MSEKDSANIASERAVLSGVIKFGKDAFVEVAHIIDESTFTVDYNKVVFKCLSKSLESDTRIDLSSILSSATQLGLNEFVEKPSVLKHIRSLMEFPILLENVHHHGKIIRRLQIVREIQNDLREVYRELSEIDGTEGISSIFAIPETHLQKIALKYIRDDNNQPALIKEGLTEYIQNLRDNPNKAPGISSGYNSWDKAIGGGLRRKCVDLIGARSKAGKSVLADNITLHVAGKNKIPVLMLDTEMNNEDHWNRLLGNLSGIPMDTIVKGEFADNEMLDSKIKMANSYIQDMPYHYINVSGKSFDEILGIARRWLLKEVGYDENGRMKDCLIIYDYLKLMTSSSINGNMAEFQALGFQITQLHNFCVEYDCPCLSFVQLNRDGLTKEGEDAISGSDRLIWLCTSFSIFKVKTADEIITDGLKCGNRKLIPVVSRHGPGTGDDGYICMQMTGDVAKIEELGTVKYAKQRAAAADLGFDDKPDEAGGERES